MVPSLVPSRIGAKNYRNKKNYSMRERQGVMHGMQKYISMQLYNPLNTDRGYDVSVWLWVTLAQKSDECTQLLLCIFSLILNHFKYFHTVVPPLLPLVFLYTTHHLHPPHQQYQAQKHYCSLWCSSQPGLSQSYP